MSLKYKAGMHVLNIAEEVSNTQAEGPGHRYALWLQGCPIRCPGCCNPQMLDFIDKRLETVDQVSARILNTPGIEGVTYLGGEPLAQAEPLAALSSNLQKHGLSIMLFSGYTYRHIQQSHNTDWLNLLAHTDLLVAGPYRQSQFSQNRRWIGSSNQEIVFLSERYKYLQALDKGWDDEPNTVEIRMQNGQITVNGFPTEPLQKWLKFVDES